MKSFHQLKYIFGLFWGVGLAFSQIDNSDEILTQYIRIGLENNASIKKNYKQWESAEAKVAFAKGLPNPSISFGYFLENVETAAGPQEFKIGITQKIPWFGKRKADENAQTAKAKMAFAQLEKIRLSITHEVRKVWYDYYYLTRITDLTQQNFELIQNWDSVIRSKYVTSRTGHPDLIKTQIELIQLEDDLLSLENQKQPLLESFQSLLNREEFLEIIVPDSFSFTWLNMDKSKLIETIKHFNPDLWMAQAELEMSQAKLKRAKLNRLPDFGIGLEKIGTGEKDGSVFSGKDPVVAKISLDLPVWFRKNKSAIKSAKFAQESIEQKINSVENKLLSKLEKILYELKESERKVKLYQNVLIPKGLESLGATEKAYRSDKIDFLSLVDAQQRLLTFQMKYEKALINYLKAKSKLSILTGEKV
ncbi:MAG: TolC family protein [Candidatus Marinimicrobia bacterium]|nr:TolC family protein [Candidatus Neomarinimicrobiota bacterium]MBT6914649.1 TolC family protein [Candidatus Neomarinimicrobiota bacterium]